MPIKSSPGNPWEAVIKLQYSELRSSAKDSDALNKLADRLAFYKRRGFVSDTTGDLDKTIAQLRADAVRLASTGVSADAAKKIDEATKAAEVAERARAAALAESARERAAADAARAEVARQQTALKDLEKRLAAGGGSGGTGGDFDITDIPQAEKLMLDPIDLTEFDKGSDVVGGNNYTNYDPARVLPAKAGGAERTQEEVKKIRLIETYHIARLMKAQRQAKDDAVRAKAAKLDELKLKAENDFRDLLCDELFKDPAFQATLTAATPEIMSQWFDSLPSWAFYVIINEIRFAVPDLSDKTGSLTDRITKALNAFLTEFLKFNSTFNPHAVSAFVTSAWLGGVADGLYASKDAAYPVKLDFEGERATLAADFAGEDHVLLLPAKKDDLKKDLASFKRELVRRLQDLFMTKLRDEFIPRMIEYFKSVLPDATDTSDPKKLYKTLFTRLFLSEAGDLTPVVKEALQLADSDHYVPQKVATFLNALILATVLSPYMDYFEDPALAVTYSEDEVSARWRFFERLMESVFALYKDDIPSFMKYYLKHAELFLIAATFDGAKAVLKPSLLKRENLKSLQGSSDLLSVQPPGIVEAWQMAGSALYKLPLERYFFGGDRELIARVNKLIRFNQPEILGFLQNKLESILKIFTEKDYLELFLKVIKGNSSDTTYLKIYQEGIFKVFSKTRTFKLISRINDLFSTKNTTDFDKLITLFGAIERSFQELVDLAARLGVTISPTEDKPESLTQLDLLKSQIIKKHMKVALDGFIESEGQRFLASADPRIIEMPIIIVCRALDTLDSAIQKKLGAATTPLAANHTIVLATQHLPALAKDFCSAGIRPLYNVFKRAKKSELARVQAIVNSGSTDFTGELSELLKALPVVPASVYSFLLNLMISEAPTLVCTYDDLKDKLSLPPTPPGKMRKATIDQKRFTATLSQDEINELAYALLSDFFEIDLSFVKNPKDFPFSTEDWQAKFFATETDRGSGRIIAYKYVDSVPVEAKPGDKAIETGLGDKFEILKTNGFVKDLVAGMGKKSLTILFADGLKSLFTATDVSVESLIAKGLFSEKSRTLIEKIILRLKSYKRLSELQKEDKQGEGYKRYRGDKYAPSEFVTLLREFSKKKIWTADVKKSLTDQMYGFITAHYTLLGHFARNILRVAPVDQDSLIAGMEAFTLGMDALIGDDGKPKIPAWTAHSVSTGNTSEAYALGSLFGTDDDDGEPAKPPAPRVDGDPGAPKEKMDSGPKPPKVVGGDKPATDLLKDIFELPVGDIQTQITTMVDAARRARKSKEFVNAASKFLVPLMAGTRTTKEALASFVRPMNADDCVPGFFQTSTLDGRSAPVLLNIIRSSSKAPDAVDRVLAVLSALDWTLPADKGRALVGLGLLGLPSLASLPLLKADCDAFGIRFAWPENFNKGIADEVEAAQKAAEKTRASKGKPKGTEVTTLADAKTLRDALKHVTVLEPKKVQNVMFAFNLRPVTDQLVVKREADKLAGQVGEQKDAKDRGGQRVTELWLTDFRRLLSAGNPEAAFRLIKDKLSSAETSVAGIDYVMATFLRAKDVSAELWYQFIAESLKESVGGVPRETVLKLLLNRMLSVEDKGELNDLYVAKWGGLTSPPPVIVGLTNPWAKPDLAKAFVASGFDLGFFLSTWGRYNPGKELGDWLVNLYSGRKPAFGYHMLYNLFDITSVNDPRKPQAIRALRTVAQDALQAIAANTLGLESQYSGSGVLEAILMRLNEEDETDGLADWLEQRLTALADDFAKDSWRKCLAGDHNTSLRKLIDGILRKADDLGGYASPVYEDDVIDAAAPTREQIDAALAEYAAIKAEVPADRLPDMLQESLWMTDLGSWARGVSLKIHPDKHPGQTDKYGRLIARFNVLVDTLKRAGATVAEAGGGADGGEAEGGEADDDV